MTLVFVPAILIKSLSETKTSILEIRLLSYTGAINFDLKISKSSVFPPI